MIAGLLGWAIIASLVAICAILHGWKIRLPFFDQGHRLLCVTDEKAFEVVARILRYNGLKPWVTIQDVGTKQLVFCDGTTLILPPGGNGFSLVTSRPAFQARQTADLLTRYGFSATIHPVISDAMYQVHSNAFQGGSLIFRLPEHRMPKKPGMLTLHLFTYPPKKG